MNPEVIITNMKKRYSGVSGTVNALLPVQAKTLSIGFVGTDLPGAQLAKRIHSDTFFYLRGSTSQTAARLIIAKNCYLSKRCHIR
jgi:bifunctional ADP-heptose synthase (sugar kinase/adenylyltransferase)